MAYAPHTLVQMSGTLGTGADAEIFSFGVRGTFSHTGTADAALEGWLTDRAPAIATWFGSSIMRTDSVLTLIKANEIGADGKYVDPSVTHARGVNAAGTGPAGVPPMITLAWSWRGSRTRGPGANGRVYPPVAFGANGSPRITSTLQNTHRTAALALLTILATTVTANTASFDPVIASRVDATNTPITQVRIGDVLDVQRRRKNKLRENYALGAFAG